MSGAPSALNCLRSLPLASESENHLTFSPLLAWSSRRQRDEQGIRRVFDDEQSLLSTPTLQRCGCVAGIPCSGVSRGAKHVHPTGGHSWERRTLFLGATSKPPFYLRRQPLILSGGGLQRGVLRNVTAIGGCSCSSTRWGLRQCLR